MTTPTFTTPPTMPARTQAPATYITNFNAFLAWLAVFFTEMTAGVAWIAAQVTAIVGYVAAAAASALTASTAATAVAAATGYLARSTDSLTIGTGAKNLTTGLVGKSFANLDQVTLIDANNAANRMWGAVSSANMGAGTMTVTVGAGAFAGSGTITNWIVEHRAFESIFAASTAELLASTSSITAATPASFAAAAAPAALTDGATITPDLNTAANFIVTLGGNRTLANPSNLVAGKCGVITVKQDGTGSRTLAYGGGWKFPGSTPALSTAAGAVDTIAYYVEDSAAPVIRAVLSKAYS